MTKYEETIGLNNLWKIIGGVSTLVFACSYFLVDHRFLVGFLLSGIFTSIIWIMKLSIKVYEDRLEYRLLPFHKSYTVVSKRNITSVEVTSPGKVKIYGFKIKSTPTGSYYYLGGKQVVRIKTANKRDLYLSTGSEDLYRMLMN